MAQSQGVRLCLGAPGEPVVKRPQPRLAKYPASPLKIVSDPEALGQVILGAVRMLGNLGEQGPMGPAGQAARGGWCSELREQDKDEGAPGATGHGCWLDASCSLK